MRTVVYRVHLAAKQKSQTSHACAVFARKLKERTGMEVQDSPADKADLILDLRPDLGPDGFAIEQVGGAVRIAGQSRAGLMHGIGKFLRTSRYGATEFTPSAWRGTSVPQAPVRGMYLAFNFNNWYVSCPREELARYLDDLALWGFNAIQILPLMADPADQPAFEKRVADNRTVLNLIKEAGMKPGFLVPPNYGFPNVPKEALATAVPDTTPARRGNAAPGDERRICPSHPKGKEFLHSMLDLLMKGYEDIGIHYVAAFPYDFGGCGCKQCSPWGARGFVDLCKDFSRITRARYPECRFILTTWCYDALGSQEGEYAGLNRVLQQGNDWCHYIMADSHEDFPRYPLEQGVPGGLPLLNFPEISMWGRYPWGGYGANPLPSRFQRLWGQIKHLCQGGFPYSEGIFEDINKAVVSQFYWNREGQAEDTLREYIAYEYAPEVVEPVLEAIRLLEKNLPRSTWQRTEVERAYDLIIEADRHLSARARASWRWRILYLRAVIDYEIITHPDQPHSDRCDEAFEELTTIYHAENTGGPDAPPSRRCRARLQRAAQAQQPPPGSDEK
jgi:hypothetical protein